MREWPWEAKILWIGWPLLMLILLWLLVFPACASAESIRFSWTYGPLEKIGGFRLMRNGNIVEVDNIPANARTVSTVRQTDKLSHVYAIIAYNEGEVSGSSTTVIDPYVVIKPRSVGLLQAEIVPDN